MKMMLMRKKIILIAFATLSTLVASAASPMVMEMEMGVAEQVEQDRSITLTVEENSVTVSGAAGMTLEVVSLTGRHVTSYKIDSPAQRVELNLPKGCYILKIGKVVRKVTIR